MATTASKIETVRSLRREAANLRGACARWNEKYSDRKHYDKQGFGFTSVDRSGAFQVPVLVFEAYVGTYGSSSVSTAWRVDQSLVHRLLPKALNAHKQAIFDTMAALAEAEAAELLEGARAELADIHKLLEEAGAPVGVEAA